MNAEIKYIIASWLPINVRDTLRTNDNDNSCSAQLKQKTRIIIYTQQYLTGATLAVWHKLHRADSSTNVQYR